MAQRPNIPLLAAVGLVLAFVQGASLSAQSTGGWVSLPLGPNIPGDVRVMVKATSEGYEVYFKNSGAAVVHFGFYGAGVQTEDDVPANGRIHLKSGSAGGPFLIQPRQKPHGTIHIHAVEAAVGELDGPSAPDTQD